MVDDLGYMPDDRVLERLPNIKDLFLDGGLRFTAYYSETPVCCPGRAGFLTGQHTRHHGVVRNDARLFDPSNTVATMLDDAGYRTSMMAAKYLNMADRLTDHTPPGWDHVVMRKTATRTTSTWWMDDLLVFDTIRPTRSCG